jgi:hypothetical protein
MRVVDPHYPLHGECFPVSRCVHRGLGILQRVSLPSRPAGTKSGALGKAEEGSGQHPIQLPILDCLAGPHHDLHDV